MYDDVRLMRIREGHFEPQRFRDKPTDTSLNQHTLLDLYNMCPCSRRSHNSTDIFVAITNHTLNGSKLSFFFNAKNH